MNPTLVIINPQLKVQARDPKKIYVIDKGLRTVSLVSGRGDWGRMAENITYRVKEKTQSSLLF